MARYSAFERAGENNAAPDDPPHHLNDNARSKWHETWPRLDHNHFDADRDRDTLAEYCEAFADIHQADTEIQGRAQIAKTRTQTGAPEQDSDRAGQVYEQRAAAMERFDRAGERLGLSLVAPPSHPWADYLDVLKFFPQELAALDEIEANSTVPQHRRIWTRKRVWDALQRSFGNIAAAARLLSKTYGVTCTRSTISFLVKKYPQLRAAIEECEEFLLDTCYTALFTSASVGDGASQRFLLCKFHPDFQN